MFNLPISYEPPVYRPPSEGPSLLFQVTIGCSNNLCTYCDMYRSKSYRVRPIEEIKRDIHLCANSLVPGDKIFLCDGDALGAPMSVLEETLKTIQEVYPNCRRVGIYATAENILNKTENELKLLNKLGLGIAYLGLESGDDKVLHMIVKGNTAAEMREASLKIKRCGFKLSTIAMLGVGGQKHSENHIEGTAKLLSETCPDFFSFLTTFSVPGTPYHTMIERGLIKPLTSKMLFKEMHDILENSTFDLNPVIFRANHVSNQHPLGGTLSRDKSAIVHQLKEWIAHTPEGVFPPRPHQM
ncbi:MAG: radical SAM protein [Bacteriovoracaceae bacterium]|nr:radical SAM protein [Bacteriovoracaceae bacterium]